MPGDDDLFETVAGPARRDPARTARRLAIAGAVTIALGAILLIGTVSLFDDSLNQANERRVDRSASTQAEVPVGEAEAVQLDGERAWDVFAIIDPDVAPDIAAGDLDLPEVRITGPDGDSVPITRGDPVDRPVANDPDAPDSSAVDGLTRRAVSIGRFRAPTSGAYEVQVAVADSDVAAVGIGDAWLPDLGDVGGAASTFLATAAAGLLLGLGALMFVVGVGGWLWFRAPRPES
jgi:hypothetical protein